MSYEVEKLILINMISDIIIIVFLVKVNRRDIGKFEFEKSYFKEILSFSLWQFFGFSGVYLVNFGDIAVIKNFMSIEYIGVYNAAYKLYAGIAGLSFVINSFYSPSVSMNIENGDTKELHHFFYRDRVSIISIVILLHLIVILSSKHIVLLLYGSRYLPTVPLINILLIGSIFRYLGVFYMIYYNTTKQYMILQSTNVIRALVNISLDIILIQYFGIKGPAIATILTSIMAFVFSFFYCEKRIKKLCSIRKPYKDMYHVKGNKPKLLFLGDLFYDYHDIKKDIISLGNIIKKNNYHVILNIENPIKTNKPIKPWINLYNTEAIIAVLKELNVIAVCLSNNHIMDWRRDGFNKLLKILTENNIQYFGAGLDLEEALEPVVLEVSGQKIGLLGFGWEEAMCVYARKNRPGVAPLRKDTILKSINQLKESVDLIVVNTHWGYEYEIYPLPIHRQLAHQMIDQGANIVIGHHPPCHTRA